MYLFGFLHGVLFTLRWHSFLQVPERATPQNDEEEEEDEFIRKLREELEMLKEIEEVVQNVLACIKLGLPIRVKQF